MAASTYVAADVPGRWLAGLSQSIPGGLLPIGRKVIELGSLRLTTLAPLGGVFRPRAAVAAPALARVKGFCH